MPEFFKSCPKCRFKNGFNLPEEAIAKDEIYQCENCYAEFKLSEFGGKNQDG